MNTMLFFKVCSEKKAIQSIFNYYHLNYLTNPECSFVSNLADVVCSMIACMDEQAFFVGFVNKSV